MVVVTRVIHGFVDMVVVVVRGFVDVVVVRGLVDVVVVRGCVVVVRDHQRGPWLAPPGGCFALIRKSNKKQFIKQFSVPSKKGNSKRTCLAHPWALELPAAPSHARPAPVWILHQCCCWDPRQP